MKRKKRFPKLMFILLVLLAIVLVWLLIMSRQKAAPINTKLFPTTGQAPVAAPAPETVTEAAPETQPETQPETTPAPEETTAAPAPETQAETTAAPASTAGTPVDTGVIRTVCPDGWLYIQQRDVFGQVDENGEYPLDPTQMCFSKGATTEMDVFSKLSVYVYFRDEPYSQQVYDTNAMWYSETEPITATINGVECQGFHAKDADIFNEGQYYEYDFIFMPVDDGHHFQFRLMNSAPGNADTISRDDPDVQQIMTSMAVD